MIRLVTPNDYKALMEIAEAVGLFSPSEFEELGKILMAYFWS